MLKTILLDLDGVLNKYDGNYDKEYIPPIKEGAYELIKELSQNYKIVIFTVINSFLVFAMILPILLKKFYKIIHLCYNYHRGVYDIRKQTKHNKFI